MNKEEGYISSTDLQYLVGKKGVQVVVEFVFGNDVPVEGTAYLFYRAVVRTEEVEHSILFLYDQELAGHFNKLEIVVYRCVV